MHSISTWAPPTNVSSWNSSATKASTPTPSPFAARLSSVNQGSLDLSRFMKDKPVDKSSKQDNAPLKVTKDSSPRQLQTFTDPPPEPASGFQIIEDFNSYAIGTPPSPWIINPGTFRITDFDSKRVLTSDSYISAGQFLRRPYFFDMSKKGRHSFEGLFRMDVELASNVQIIIETTETILSFGLQSQKMGFYFKYNSVVDYTYLSSTNTISNAWVKMRLDVNNLDSISTATLYFKLDDDTNWQIDPFVNNLYLENLSKVQQYDKLRVRMDGASTGGRYIDDLKYGFTSFEGPSSSASPSSSISASPTKSPEASQQTSNQPSPPPEPASGFQVIEDFDSYSLGTPPAPWYNDPGTFSIADVDSKRVITCGLYTPAGQFLRKPLSLTFPQYGQFIFEILARMDSTAISGTATIDIENISTVKKQLTFGLARNKLVFLYDMDSIYRYEDFSLESNIWYNLRLVVNSNNSTLDASLYYKKESDLLWSVNLPNFNRKINNTIGIRDFNRISIRMDSGGSGGRYIDYIKYGYTSFEGASTTPLPTTAKSPSTSAQESAQPSIQPTQNTSPDTSPDMSTNTTPFASTQPTPGVAEAGENSKNSVSIPIWVLSCIGGAVGSFVVTGLSFLGYKACKRHRKEAIPMASVVTLPQSQSENTVPSAPPLKDPYAV